MGKGPVLDGKSGRSARKGSFPWRTGNLGRLVSGGPAYAVGRMSLDNHIEYTRAQKFLVANSGRALLDRCTGERRVKSRTKLTSKIDDTVGPCVFTHAHSPGTPKMIERRFVTGGSGRSLGVRFCRQRK